MSGFLHSRLLNPVVRQARRLQNDSRHDTTNETAEETVTVEEQSPGVILPLERGLDQSSASGNTATRVGSDPVQIQDQSSLPESITYNAISPMNEAPPARIPTVARQNGFQGLIPLDDIRSSYVYDSPPVLTPDEISTAPVPARNPSTRSMGSRTIDSLSEMSLDDQSQMSRNPSMTTSGRVPEAMSLYSNISRSSGEGQSRGNNPSLGGQSLDGLARGGGSVMSNALPEDDGMKALREQMHQIEQMALSSEEKAKKMHELMVSDYRALQLSKGIFTPGVYLDENMSNTLGVAHAGFPSKQRSPSPGMKEELIVTVDDLRPSYTPQTPTNDTSEQGRQGSCSDDEDEERPLGCKHYSRNIKVNCPDCGRWYPCRHCHDEAEHHVLDRKGIRNMLCMLCGHAQPAAEYCTQCGEQAAAYYCSTCKLWENDARRKIYHCNDCGICRRGAGLGKDFMHCKKCNVCVSIAWAATHRCVERATECGCPICNEYMFSSSLPVVAMRCGHYIHRKCYDAYMQTSYKCPICSRSAVNMELQWRKLDRHIEGQPMPSQFTDTRVWVTCNDCAARSCTKYHWLGNKCLVCDSYNTNEIKLVNSPAEHEANAIAEAQVQRDRMVEDSMATLGAPAPPASDIALADGHVIASVAQAPAAETNMASSSTSTITDGQVDSTNVTSSRGRNVAVDSIAHTEQSRESTNSQPIFNSATHPGATQMQNNPYPFYPTSSSQPMNLQEQAPSGTNSLRGEDEDDAPFWGEPITPWTIPSMSMPVIAMPSMPSMPGLPAMAEVYAGVPQMPQMPQNWPNLPSMPNLPNLPSYNWSNLPNLPNLPNMPNLPNLPSFPNLPNLPKMGAIPIPTMPAMPSSISPRFNGWTSPKFFASKKRERNPNGMDGTEEEDHDDDDDGTEVAGGNGDDDSDDDMTWDGDADGEEDEDGDVDEMELFGHR